MTCPSQCFKQQIDELKWECVCPTDSGDQTSADCDPTLEVCSEVYIIPVDAGFTYSENNFRNWAIMTVSMVGYSTYAGEPYSTDTPMSTAWYYNFFWIYLTWGLQLFFMINKVLFKSEGGAIHHWFVRMVNLSVVNFFLVYWAIDLVIIRGQLSDESNA